MGFKESSQYLKVLYYIPAMENVTNDIKQFYREHIKNINNVIIRRISNVIDKGSFKRHNGTYVSLSLELSEYLKQIVTHINSKQIEFAKLNTELMTTKEYQRESYRYRAVELFDSKQEVLYSFHDSLFPEFADRLLVGLRGLLQSGGGNGSTQEDKYDMGKEEFDFTLLPDVSPDENILEYVIPRHVISNRIYKALCDIYPEKTKDSLCYLADDMYSKLIRYYGYVGESCVGLEFLKACIRIITERELLLHEFEELHFAYKQMYPDEDSDSIEETEREPIHTDYMENFTHTHMISSIPKPIKVGGKKKRQTRKNRKH
jgi:hypothetical protein